MIVPTSELPPAMPFTSHATLAPAARQKEAENACVWPSPTFADGGEIEFVALHVTVALALPVFELSAALAAVIVTVAGDGGIGGAVYSAVVALVLAIVPTVPLPPAIPLTLQLTPVAALPRPEMFAVKTCSPLVGTLAVFGETLTAMSSLRLTLAEPLACAAAWLTAVTVTLGGEGSTCGAVYVAVPGPVATIVPKLEFPPATPFTSHEMLASGAPATVA